MPKKSDTASSDSMDEGRRAMLDKAVPSCVWVTLIK
jgi:hypothetical protein